jgi:hypothetical protein
MARTNVNDLKQILDETSLGYSILSAYINSANVFVTAALTGKGLSDAVLTEIEKWMAAHMITVTRERVAKEEGAGGAYIKYAGEWGAGLASTSYGQMAINLDTSNTLQAMSDGKRTATSRAIISFDDSKLLS